MSIPGGNDPGGPIPFEKDSSPPAKRPQPPRAAPSPTDPAKEVKCPKCGYSLAGLPGVTCPECGSDEAKRIAAIDRRSRADLEQRAETKRAFFTVLAGLGAMSLALCLSGLISDELAAVPKAILFALVLYAILVPLGLLVYMALAAIWFGSDESAGITFMRLASAYALADAAAVCFGLVPVPVLTQLLVVGTYIGLLMKFLDLEGIEAVVFGVISAGLKIGAFIGVAILFEAIF